MVSKFSVLYDVVFVYVCLICYDRPQTRMVDSFLRPNTYFFGVNTYFFGVNTLLFWG